MGARYSGNPAGWQCCSNCVTVPPVRRKPELVAPAGNMECARAAVANGANAVYFGLPRFNARMRADNFTEAQLPELVKFLHDHGARALAVLNILIFPGELAEVERELIALDAAGVDAVMVQDLGLAKLAQQLGLRMEVHASTQMTVTSPEGVRFITGLGIKRVVLARELALRELAKFDPALMEIEVFVHGALCVAYSGQCLTSEALGQRSANRGECASACRLPYELVVDGARKEFGDRRYLLSPQDLAAVREIPELIRLGVAALKIEGRLKSPEYVAATTQVYRKAIDAALITESDFYKLEMTFSRGLYTGWFHGVNHQQLVPARFGSKRGPLVGAIRQVSYDHVEVEMQRPVQAGDGILFDTGSDPESEQGGRVWEVRENRLYFERGKIDFKALKVGDRVWKTSDPHLEKELRRSFQGTIPSVKQPLDMRVAGKAGEALTLEAGGVTMRSAMPLQVAQKRPLTTESLREQLGRLGDTDFALGELRNELVGEVILPVSELNRLSRELVAAVCEQRARTAKDGYRAPVPRLAKLVEEIHGLPRTTKAPELIPLCRTMEQVEAALEAKCGTLYADFKDIRRYPEVVARTRGQAAVFLATPRIQKAGEQGFFKTIAAAKPEGVLIRNLGALEFFRESGLRRIGDYSLNVANPLTAELLMRGGLERVTVSYDLNAQQALDLLRAAPAQWFELVVHQHLPMFHMDHCVFAAFLSKGTDHTNCGRPCDFHRVELRDRVGVAHPLKADVGCRNTVFHARAQSGAEFLDAFRKAGASTFRVELLDENAEQARETLECYRQLMTGEITGAELSRRLKVVNQLGVTSGTLTVLG